MSIFRLNAEVEINAERLIEGLDSLVDDDVKTRIHALYAETVDPWTPFLTGALHSDITVNAEGVTYNVPYAAEKYYGTVFHKEEHLLATDHWDKVAMETEMEAFVEKVKEILTMRAKQAHG